jgi:putative ABC transport system permease protein
VIRLAGLMLRGRRGQVAALAVTVFFSAVLLGAFGLLLETGVRGQVATGEYHDAPLLIGPRPSVPVSSDVDMAIPGRAVLPASVVDDVAKALPTSRVVADRIVPATFDSTGADDEPVDAHPWSAFALGNRELASGRAPAGPDQIVVPGQLARAHGLIVGSEVRLGFGDQAVEYTIAGTTAADDAGIDVPDVYLSDAQIGAHGNPDRRVAVVGVWPQQKADAEVLARLAAQHGARLWDRGDRGPIEVVSQGQAKGNLVSSAAALGSLALIVAVFTVIALTSLQIRERSRELAMLRIVGATPRQVKKLLRAEIRAVAASAALLGGLAGPFLGALMIRAIRSWGVVPRTLAPVFGPLPFVLAILTGCVAAEIAARVALRRVVHGSPLAQLEGGDESLAGSPRVARRTVVGLAVLAVGIVMALAPAYTSNVDVASGLPGLSGLVMALSIGPLSPLVVRAAAWIVRRTATRASSAYLALNSIRHRAARVGGALTPIVLGVALGAVQLSGSATSSAVSAAQLQTGYRADITVTSLTTGVGDRTAELVRDVPGVSSAIPFVTTRVIVQAPPSTGNGPQILNALGIANDKVERYADLEPATATPIRLRQGDVALGVLGAAELGAHVGDDITIVLPDGRAIKRHVSALYERGLGFGDVLLLIGDLQPATASGFASGLAVTVATSKSIPEVEHRIHHQLADRPGVDVTRSASGGADNSSSGGDKFGLLVLIILFGYIAIAVANSLITATLSRRSEFALLASVGATPHQCRGIWRWEAVFLATTSCLVGTAFALPGLIAMTYALSNGDLIAPAIDPIAYSGIVAFTFVLVLSATTLSGRAIIHAHRPA